MTLIQIYDPSKGDAGGLAIFQSIEGAQIHTQTLELAAMGHQSFETTSVIANAGARWAARSGFNDVSFTTIPVMPRAVP